VRFCSMNDVDVVLRIIKNSEKTLKRIVLSHNGWDMDEAQAQGLLLQQSQDTSLDYYNFNLDLASFTWYMTKDSKQAAGFISLAKRSNLLHHITEVLNVWGTIGDVLDSMRRLRDINIPLTTELTLAEKFYALELLIRTDSVPGLLCLSPDPIPRGSNIQPHALKKLRDDLGIELSF
jgi:hypothetical protein